MQRSITALLLAATATGATARHRRRCAPTKPRSARSTRSWWRPTPPARPAAAPLAAERMAARLKAAGFPDDRPHLLFPPDHPEGRRPGRHLPGQGPQGQGRPDAGPHRRGRGQARGLDPRSLQARRGGRLLLRPRLQRRQSPGGDLGRHPDPLQEGRLQAPPHPQDGADLRRGNRRRVQRRRMAGQEPARR